MLEIITSIIFLIYQSKLDLKNKNVNNTLSWVVFYAGLGFVVVNSLKNPILFIEWLIGILFVGLFFWKIKKWFPSQFGSGDFWVLIGLQSLNPTPIASVFITFSIGAVILFIYSMKTNKEIGFIPFLTIAYIIFLLLAQTLFF